MRKLAAGNWKMNGLYADGVALAAALAARAAAEPLPCELLICPPATLLFAVAAQIRGSGIALGGQDCHAEPRGAHTGDVSAAMLRDAGCLYVILGHSERRADHGESDELVRAKMLAARAAGLVPILCIGETLAERDAGEAMAVVARQLACSLPDGFGAAEFAVAYEPVWAIGSGRTPSLPEVEQIHGHIRAALGRKLADAGAVRILYGGSVKPANAASLMRAGNVDGGLVGGASLNAADFWEIARACAA